MLRTRQLRAATGSRLLLVCSSMLFITALKYLPLADATALNYTTPAIVVVLAIAFLGERLTLPRMAFVFAGLAGMLLIVQPGAEFFNGASLLALGCGRLLRGLPDHDADAGGRGSARHALLSGVGRHRSS